MCFVMKRSVLSLKQNIERVRFSHPGSTLLSQRDTWGALTLSGNYRVRGARETFKSAHFQLLLLLALSTYFSSCFPHLTPTSGKVLPDLGVESKHGPRSIRRSTLSRPGCRPHPEGTDGISEALPKPTNTTRVDPVQSDVRSQICHWESETDDICREVLQYGSISQMLRARTHGTPGIVSDVFNISEVFQCHNSACQGLTSS